MKILVTGGAGYIGSHTCVLLLQNGYDVVVVDNLCNSKMEAVKRVEKIAGRTVKFYKQNLLEKAGLEDVFKVEKPDAVIHFAGLKAVGESVSMPLKYYHNNITGTIILLEVMSKFGCKKLVFSSSATVYGVPKSVPIREDFPLSTTNPYGATKLMIEGILRDTYKADSTWRISILRYFNPIGAHESGRIGEDPCGIPNNLLPYIAQVAIGKLQWLNVYGNDYKTKDGTGVRDYIHVVDLAQGHLAAIEKLNTSGGVQTYNLGTGKGYSVLEIIRAYERASGKKIPYVIAPRREGDIAECYADPSYASRELGWSAKFGIERMCADSWRWQSDNPDGYGEK